MYSYALVAKDLRFMQQVLEFLGITLDLPTPIFTDSTTVESWVKNPVAIARSRHCEKFLMYAREQYLTRSCTRSGSAARTRSLTFSPRRSTRPTSSASAMLY